MEEISINFLGTGNAIPTKLRNHTGILLNFLNENILVDCGEGIQRQFRKADISPTKITRILITHWHGDHILGLPGLFQTLAMSEYQKTLEIYGPKGTLKFINLIKELLMHIKIDLKVTEISTSGIFLETKDFYIEASEMEHGSPVLAYSIVLKDKIRLIKSKLKKLKLPHSPILKELQAGKDILFNNKKIKASEVTYTEKGKKVTIILDTKLNENAFKLAKSADLLIAESTFSEKDKIKAEEYLHLTSKQAATIAKKSKVKSLLLTHISQRYEHLPHIIEKEAKKTFKNTKVVKDLDVIAI